jgi:hypothetical protein
VEGTRHQNEDRLQGEAIAPDAERLAGDPDQLVRLVLELRVRQEQGSPSEPVIAS